MDFTVKLNTPSVPYLDKNMIEEYASLKFYSLNNEVVQINPLMLAALKSDMILAIDQESDCSVLTEFSLGELEAVKEFISTGYCEMNLASNALHSLGIDLKMFSKAASLETSNDNVDVKQEKEDIEVKQECLDDFKENMPYEDTFVDDSVDHFDEDEMLIENLSKSKKSQKKKKVKKRDPKVTKEPVVYNELPKDYELPLSLDEYKENPTDLYSKRNERLSYIEKDLCCGKCGLNFASSDKLEDHKLRIHKTHFKCPYCNQIFDVDTIQDFKLHIYNHEKNPPNNFKCVQCGKIFSKVGMLTNHLRVKGPYHDGQCSQCSMVFVTFEDYKNHVKKDHFGQWSYKCGFCGVNFETIKSLTAHVSYTHKGRAKVQKAKVKAKPQAEKVCEECGKSVRNLRGHMLRIHEAVDLQIPCDQCDMKFQTAPKLKEHVMWIHMKDPCPDCGLLIGRRKMRRHRASAHKAEKNFKCEVCSKSFINRQRLKDHVNTHTGEKPYKCKYCSACFASAGTHAMHQRGHLGYRRPK